MRKKLQSNWFYRTEAGRWITALIVAAVTLVVIFLCESPVFMTIDDGRLKYVFAGYSSGEPVSSYLFSYYPLSAILSALYTAFPGFHWYGFYQFGVIGLSSALIGKTVYKIAYKKNLHFIFAIACHLWLYITVALISTLLMHFEVTAAMAATAGVVLLLGMDFSTDKRNVKIVDILFSVLGIGASYVIQFNAFYAACCYLIVAYFFHILSGIKQKNLRKNATYLLCYLLLIAVIIGGVMILEDAAKDTPEWDTYMEYNKYRVSFWDYPHISYDDDPALFEQMGWSKEFYQITQSMYFMDERFNKDNLAMFTERFSWFDFRSWEDMKTTFTETVMGLFKSEPLVNVQTIVLGAFLLYFIGALCNTSKRTRYYPHILSAICCIGGTAFVLMFLAAKGRLPLRAWLACTIPCISIVVLLCLMMYYVPRKGGRTNWLKSTVSVVVLLAWLAGNAWVYNDTVKNEMSWRRRHSDGALLMEDYVINHPDKIYVYDLMGAQNYSVFSCYPDEDRRPTNAFVWGSSYLFTPVYYDQLSKNGLDSLTTENFVDNSVYFIAHGSGTYTQLLHQFLQAEYGEVELVPIAQIENKFVVYIFRKV